MRFLLQMPEPCQQGLGPGLTYYRRCQFKKLAIQFAVAEWLLGVALSRGLQKFLTVPIVSLHRNAGCSLTREAGIEFRVDRQFNALHQGPNRSIRQALRLKRRQPHAAVEQRRGNHELQTETGFGRCLRVLVTSHLQRRSVGCNAHLAYVGGGRTGS